MKKKMFLIFVAILVVACSVVFVSCNKDKTPTERGNISRTISAFYAGENDNFAVSIQSGKREKNFMADGKAVDVVDFTELTILPLKVHDCEEYVFVINGESATLSGKVKGNEFGEYIISVNLDFTPVSVTIGEGEGADAAHDDDFEHGNPRGLERTRDCDYRGCEAGSEHYARRTFCRHLRQGYHHDGWWLSAPRFR